MEALARLGLFFGVYFTILILNFFNNSEFNYFQISSFLFANAALSGWLYYLHFIKKELSNEVGKTIYQYKGFIGFT